MCLKNPFRSPTIYSFCPSNIFFIASPFETQKHFPISLYHFHLFQCFTWDCHAWNTELPSSPSSRPKNNRTFSNITLSREFRPSAITVFTAQRSEAAVTSIHCSKAFSTYNANFPWRYPTFVHPLLHFNITHASSCSNHFQAITERLI